MMPELSLNILDVTQNSVTAGANLIKINISASTADDRLTISISDNGCGMTEDVQKHIFEKFYQGDTTRKAEGNGLGLALVKRIVDLCSGTVNVQSSPGNGATFIVELPL